MGEASLLSCFKNVYGWNFYMVVVGGVSFDKGRIIIKIMVEIRFVDMIKFLVYDVKFC